MALTKNFSKCKKLHALRAEFAWKNHQNDPQTIDIFIGTKLDSDVGWFAWGVNPGKIPQMVGTRALIGIKHPNGSLTINTYKVTGGTKLGCRLLPSEIDVKVRHMSPLYLDQNGYFAISATLVLPLAYNVSRLNHVWQVGYAVAGTVPKMHQRTLQNFASTATIDLTSARGRSVSRVGIHRRDMRMIHGILNILGWGTLLPIGVIIARYFNRYPLPSKRWFAFHVFCQTTGYMLGTAGWGIGLWLGSTSTNYHFPTHRLLAIFIFTFTTVQVLALRFRPIKLDEYRTYWNMYHHFLGYGLLAVIITNIFQGIKILKPDNSWKWAYTGLLGLLASTALAFEISTWIKFNRRDKSGKGTKTQSLPSQGSGETPLRTQAK
ncbi:unnamed protein product [Ilex paraguariensis]|uniref:Cytochrome b561 and DOMON domain-containing protein n=1 Tax=Ilex paraguariensis TaxID=185542 RepID=A0ABC8TDD8_9AQUA